MAPTNNLFQNKKRMTASQAQVGVTFTRRQKSSMPNTSRISQKTHEMLGSPTPVKNSDRYVGEQTVLSATIDLKSPTPKQYAGAKSTKRMEAYKTVENFNSKTKSSGALAQSSNLLIRHNRGIEQTVFDLLEKK